MKSLLKFGLPLILLLLTVVLISLLELDLKNFWTISVLSVGFVSSVHLFGYFCCPQGQKYLAQLIQTKPLSHRKKA